MAKSLSFIIFLFVLIISSCNNISRDSVRPLEPVVIRDTIYKTVYIEVSPERSKAQIYTDTLRSYLGTREATGKNDGPVVEKFTREACNMGRVAWCAAFVAYGLKVNGIEIPECACWSPCMVPENKIVWRRGDEGRLQEGLIFGLYFKSKGRVAHVGAVLEDFGDGWVKTIEGNTDSAGSREGNGVFIRLRHKSQIYVAANWI